MIYAITDPALQVTDELVKLMDSPVKSIEELEDGINSCGEIVKFPS